MNQISNSTPPRSLDELKVASKAYTELLPDDASNDLQAFFDEIFSSALAAIAAVDPYETPQLGIYDTSPMAGKSFETAGRQAISMEFRSAIMPLMLTMFMCQALTETQTMKFLRLAAAHFGMSKQDISREMEVMVEQLGITR